MKITNEKTENRQAYLTIELEPAEVEESMDAAYRRLAKKTRIPGFRKGKAPRNILERYLGKENVLEDAINDMVPSVYEKAVEEEKLEAIAHPEIEITQLEPVTFKAIIPLKPSIKLGDYSNIQVTKEAVEIPDENVNDVIDHLQHQYATWEPVDRPVQLNDLVVLDIESSVEDKPFLNQKGAQYQVLEGQTFPVKGFSDSLVGLTKNEEKEFSLNLPDDYPNQEVAGKEIVFKVTATEIKQEVLPEVCDEFATLVNPDYKTMDELRESIVKEMTERAETRVQRDYEEKLIDAVVDVSEVDFPPVLVESEVTRTIDQTFQQTGRPFEEYLKAVNKTEEQVREELKPAASLRVKRSLVLGSVSEDKKIEVTDEEINTEIENMTKDSAEERKDELIKMLNTPQVRDSIEQNLVTRKTFTLLAEIAESAKPVKKTRKKKEDK